MATTPVGNPYVESSDLVANYPAASLSLANRIDFVGVNPFANAAARDAAIPSPVQGQMCSLNDDNKGYRYDGSEWILFSGAGPGNFTNTATGTYTDGGIDYKYITFTGSGDLIVDQAGFADILVIGGGAGGGVYFGAGGGAGGHLFITNSYLPVGTLPVTVGAGGVGGVLRMTASGEYGNNGTASSVGSYYSPGGGGGAGASLNVSVTAGSTHPGLAGGSGGGACGGEGGGSAAGGSGITGLGFAGGTTSSSVNAGAGGGGGSAVGANAVAAGSVAGAGGAGAANSITNSSVTRCGGGGGGSTTTNGSGGTGGGGAGVTSGTPNAGSANTGSGGGGNRDTATAQAGGAGGSGVVIIRVVV